MARMEETYTLTELLTERDEMYSQYTVSIMGMVDNVLVAAESVLENPTQEEVVWKSIELGEKDTIIIVGVMTFPIGAYITTEDDIPVLVDEDNQDQLQKVLRIGITADMAMNGSVEEIQEFFTNRNEDISMKELKERLKDSTQEEEFETNELTDEQKKQLEMFTRQQLQDKDKLN